ncbi:Thioesterase superfamily protein [compost metagenome]
MTLLDVAMALNASYSDDEKRGVVTIEMKTNFLRPGGTAGEVLEAFGTVTHRTRSIAFCEAELRNAEGEVLASASGTFKYLNRTFSITDA